MTVLVLLIVFNSLAFALGNYPCLCSYKLEIPVYKLKSNTSDVLGYMYEFDCKPVYPIGGSGNNDYHAVQYEQQVGYVETSPGSLSIENCPGMHAPFNVVTTGTQGIETTTTAATTSSKTPTQTTPALTTTASSPSTTAQLPYTRSPFSTTLTLTTITATTTPNPTTTTPIPISTKPLTTTPTLTTTTSYPSSTTQLPSTYSPSSTTFTSTTTTSMTTSDHTTTTSIPISTYPTTTATPSKRTTLSKMSSTKTTTLKATISHKHECQDGWIQLDQSCYYFNLQERVGHAMASERCLRDNAHLVFVDSDSEQHLISSYLHPHSGNKVWMGGERINHVWKWMDDTTKINIPFTYSFWSPHYPHQPDSQGHSYNCAAMVGRANGHWLDFACTDELNYVCERPIIISTPIPQTVTTSRCPPSYVKHRNSCYHVNLRVKKSRFTANEACRVHNAHLAFIETEREQNFLADYIHGLPAYAHAKEDHSTNIWIGGLQLSHTWYWKSHTNQGIMSYTHWYQHKTNSTADRVCAAMVGIHQFKWDGGPCSSHHFYICEKELPQHVALIG